METVGQKAVKEKNCRHGLLEREEKAAPCSSVTEEGTLGGVRRTNSDMKGEK